MPLGGFDGLLGAVVRPVHAEVRGEQPDLPGVLLQPAAQHVAGVVSVVPVPVPVMRDPELGGLVVTLAQLRQKFRVDGRIAPGPGVFGRLVRFAEYLDHVGGPGLQAAGAEPGDRAGAADHVLAALLHPGQLRQEFLVGAVPVADQDAGEERQDRRDRGVLTRPERPQPGQPAVRGAHHQHVRCPGLVLLQPGVRVQQVHRGLVGGQHRLALQRSLHRLVEAGVFQPGIEPLAGAIDEPGRDGHAQQHADQVRGPLGGHVPVRGQQHRGSVDPRPVGDAARVRPRRRLRGVDLAAARAGQQRQQVLGHELRDGHVPDLRPPGPRPLRALQPSTAARALRRRRQLFPPVRVRRAGQPCPRVPGLPAALAVRAAFPLRGLPGLPLRLAPLPRLNGLPGRRRARGRAVRPEPAFQLGDLQLQPAAQLPLSVQLSPQHRNLAVLGLDNGPQPGKQLTRLTGVSRQTRRTGHKTRSCSTSTRDSTTSHSVSHHAVNSGTP